jgi:FtsP/CotA-like multicopper oxidase with cupredoxin domain
MHSPLISRRVFIAGALAGVGTVAATGASGIAAYQNRANTLAALAPVREYKSVNGVLRAELTAALGRSELNGEQVGGAMSYDGLTPGPTLRVKPGDRIILRIINKLAQPTNVHYHGMHVSPKGNQDNVFIQINSNESYTYEVHVPKDHPGGLYWYHPHWHPDVGPQVWGGMSGLLVVEGGAADVPEIKSLRRLAISLRNTAVEQTASGPVIAEYNKVPTQDQIHLVNGEVMPTIRMRPGESQFWQLANIGDSVFYQLELDDHEFTVVEEDGVMVWRSWQANRLLFPPGKRFGIVVTANDRERDFTLRSRGFYAGQFVDWPPVDLATVRVRGVRSTPAVIPEILGTAPAWLSDTPRKRRVLTLSTQFSSGPPSFLIDGDTWEEITVDDVPKVELGSTEEWIVRNASSKLGGNESGESHPFHMHVNSMVVVERGNWNPATDEFTKRIKMQPRSEADTVLVPPNGYIKFKMNFADFVGRSVYHCHILFHEDHGMMGAFDIVYPDGRGVGPQQSLPTQGHHG